MSADPTRDLIGELTGQLEPVKPMPSLRASTLAVVLAWTVFLGAFLAKMGLRSELWMALTTNVAFAATLGGLLVAALGGTVAGLAARVPGREASVRGGLALAFGGLATASGLCAAIYFAAGLESEGPVAAGMCLRNAALFSVIPAMVLVGLVIRGWVSRPWIAAVAGLIGTGAVSAIGVHLHCSMDDAMHILLEHVFAPVLVMAIGAPVAAWILRVAGRR